MDEAWMTPTRKGAIAESAVVTAAVKLGINVYLPAQEGAGST